ncbi:MAG: hypothetical protein HQK51_20785, partial [Oligoflexia bacterium]|nr:hypothetical protein [Oligoflexia bacterium]
IYNQGELVENKLYQKGLIPFQKTKLTEHDKHQLTCIDNLIFNHFINFYLYKRSWEEYEEEMKKYIDCKLSYMTRKIEEDATNKLY